MDLTMTKKIKKILIANRGEIACRVIKTARKMGIATVAVYSDADKKALHVRMADEAVHIGASPAAESYLVIDKIIDACKQTNADAVHPGYGFLSENPEFARRLKKEKIIFIGPAPESMEAMGLKDAAKKLMEKAGVPVTPGYHGKDQGVKILKAKAGMIGYPVLIKAVAGGGGKGMRKVEDAKDFEDALASCQREAKSSFSDDRVLIEKYILSPRHIEVQVFGDTHGNVVHMFERDCSLQRRHQKVIEEAPAPGMTEEVRQAMTDAAVKAAQAVDYVGAGTVEFIVDGSGKLRTDGFWFMEMNTRLQVEHPVTEMITGLDLVELQIRVAQGEKLPKQKDIKMEGHAVEARLYAEDPANDFLPSIGKLELFDLFHVEVNDDIYRVDTGVETGDEISVYYDPMIAKVIAYAETRETSISQLSNLLVELGIDGLKTNRDFLFNACENKDFAQGHVDTGFISKHLAQLIPPDLSTTNEAYALAAAAILKEAELETTHNIMWSKLQRSPWQILDGWRPNQEGKTVVAFLRNDERLPVEISSFTDSEWIVKVDEKTYKIFDDERDANLLIETSFAYIDDWTRAVKDDAVILLQPGKTLRVPRYQPEAAADALGGGNAIVSPMPGKILEVRVKAGDEVSKGQKLVVMEAMKMEMGLEAPRDGVVESVDCSVGELVDDGLALITLEMDD